jgi:hypothetical protein
MQSDSSGTFTAIFMLIPLVAVPYFAIRGTKDLNGLPSVSGQDEVAFDSSDGFDDGSDASFGGEAPPFPSDEPLVMNEPAGSVGSSSDGWPDPFGSPQPVPFGTELADGGSIGDQLDRQQQKLGRNNLDGTSSLLSGEESDSAPVENVLHTEPQSKSEVARRWEAGIQNLRTAGMQNYRVESLRDKSMYFVSAFFPGQSGVMRRFEGEGKHPLNALQSVTEQVANWRRGNLSR